MDLHYYQSKSTSYSWSLSERNTLDQQRQKVAKISLDRTHSSCLLSRRVTDVNQEARPTYQPHPLIIDYSVIILFNKVNITAFLCSPGELDSPAWGNLQPWAQHCLELSKHLCTQLITVGREIESERDREVSTEFKLLSYMHIQYNMHVYMYSYGGTANGHPSAIICLSSLDVTLGIVKPTARHSKDSPLQRVSHPIALKRKSMDSCTLASSYDWVIIEQRQSFTQR